jgi:hypothetical protein
MDPSRFDTLARSLALSRRGAVKAALGLALGGLASSSGDRRAAAVKEDDPFKNLGKSCKKEKKCGSGTRCADGVCTAQVCLIGGQYRAPAMSNPDNPCQWCFPGANVFRWSDVPDGFDCPLDAPETTCLPAAACRAGACEPVPLADGTPCGTGQVCRGGLCRPVDPDPPGCTGPGCPTVCTIDGETYQAAERRVEFPCQFCSPSVSTSAWTWVEDQVPCQSDPDGPVQECCRGMCCLGFMVCCLGLESPECREVEECPT